MNIPSRQRTSSPVSERPTSVCRIIKHLQSNYNKLFELISSIVNSFSKKISLNLKGKKEPLYINKDNFLVKTLCTIFNDKTKMNVNPIAIGGATYARAFDNCISFGANMPGHEDMCHKVDEYIEIDSLILSSKIYANAIYELAK